MSDADYDRFDLMDDYGTCPECGEPMQSDEDGDGVMTMAYEFCENCGAKDYGDAVNVTNQLLAFRDAQERDRLHAEQTKGGGS